MDLFTHKIQFQCSAFKNFCSTQPKLAAVTIGGSVTLAGAIGVSLWVYAQKKKGTKEEIVKRYIHRVETAFETNKWNEAEITRQHALLASDIETYIFKSFKEKFKDMSDRQKEIGPGSLCEELFSEMLGQILHEMDKNTAEYVLDRNNTDGSVHDARNMSNPINTQQQQIYTNKSSEKDKKRLDTKRPKINWLVVSNQLVGGVFDLMLEQLKLVQQDFSNYHFLKDSLSSLFSRALPSEPKSQKTPSVNYLELILERASRISIKNQEKLYQILQILTIDDPSFLQFAQLQVAKNIYSLSTLDPHFPPSQTCLQLSSSRSNSFNSNINNNTTNTVESIECGNSGQLKSQIYKLHRLVSSPVCKLLTQLNISESCSQSMVDQGFLLRIYENACGLAHRQGSELVSAEKSIETLFLMISKTLSTRAVGIRILQAQGGILCNLLMKGISFQEAAETTSMHNSTIVSLVNWVAQNFDVVLARMRTSKLLRQALLQLMNCHKETFQLITRNYLNELQWIHQIRRDDRLRQYQQLEVELSMSTLFLPLILKSLNSLPSQMNINSTFDKLFIWNSQQDRQTIVNTLTTTLSSFLFSKELFTTMLEKTSSSTNALILAFTNFKQLFSLPDARKYDEIILGLQFAILLGGAGNLCESIVEQWKKDALEYDDLKIYMSSDVAFLLQILENDSCLLNVYGLKDKEYGLDQSQFAILKGFVLSKIQKLIVNYLQVFNSMEKDNIREQLKNQLSLSVLEWEGLFDIAIENTTQQSLKYSVMSVNSSFNHSVATMNHSMSANTRLELQEQYLNKFFASLFNSNVPLLMKLLASAQTRQLTSQNPIREDYQIESKLNDSDQPLLYLQQVRREILKDIPLHTTFHAIFIQNEIILLEKLRVVCRILQYIYDVIEDGILHARASKRLEDDQIKSLLILYVFDPQLPSKIQYVSSLTDEDGELVALHFLPTLQNITFRRNALKDLLRDIFKGQNISEIIV